MRLPQFFPELFAPFSLRICECVCAAYPTTSFQFTHHFWVHERSTNTPNDFFFQQSAALDLVLLDTPFPHDLQIRVPNNHIRFISTQKSEYLRETTPFQPKGKEKKMSSLPSRRPLNASSSSSAAAAQPLAIGMGISLMPTAQRLGGPASSASAVGGATSSSGSAPQRRSNSGAAHPSSAGSVGVVGQRRAPSNSARSSAGVTASGSALAPIRGTSAGGAPTSTAAPMAYTSQSLGSQPRASSSQLPTRTAAQAPVAAFSFQQRRAFPASAEVLSASSTVGTPPPASVATTAAAAGRSVGHGHANGEAAPSSAAPTSTPAAALSDDALRIISEINNFDFGGRLGALLAQGDEASYEDDGNGGDNACEGGAAAASSSSRVIPTPPRAARPPAAAADPATPPPLLSQQQQRGGADPSPRTVRLQQRLAEEEAAAGRRALNSSNGNGYASSTHEMACGGDDPLPEDDGTMGPNGEQRHGSGTAPDGTRGGGDGPLSHLRPASVGLGGGVGSSASARAAQQAALTYYDESSPDLVVMAQRVRLLPNYQPIGGPLWEQNSELKGGGGEAARGPAAAAAANDSAQRRVGSAAADGGRERHVSAAAAHAAFAAHSAEAAGRLKQCAAFCDKASKGLYFAHLVAHIRAAAAPPAV